MIEFMDTGTFNPLDVDAGAYFERLGNV